MDHDLSRLPFTTDAHGKKVKGRSVFKYPTIGCSSLHPYTFDCRSRKHSEESSLRLLVPLN